MLENEMPKCSYQWRKVSAGDRDVYVPWNTPVEVSGQTFEFGELESREEVIAPSVEGEGAVGGDGNQDRDDVDGDSTVSSGNVDSMQVDSVQLAREAGQHEKPNIEMKKNIPVSSRPHIRHTDCLHRNVRC